MILKKWLCGKWGNKIMRYLKPYNEAKSNKQEMIDEILSKPGWKKIDSPKYEHWLIQIEYKLKDDIYIRVLDIANSNKSLNYYLVKDDISHHVSSYGDNYTQLFSEYEFSYNNLSNYERMMKICNYLLPFFTKEPSDKLKQDIRMCFIDIEDELSIDVEINWGYCNKEEFGFFPAFKFSDKLKLSLIYPYDDNKEKIKSIFEDGKNKLAKIYDIHHTYIKLINDDWRSIITIEF
jgi:hypothetical protein